MKSDMAGVAADAMAAVSASEVNAGAAPETGNTANIERPVTAADCANASLSERPWWPLFRRGAAGAFFVLVGWLLVHQARTIEWSKVTDAVREYPVATLVMAGVFAFASHLLYSTYDLFGRRHSGHDLPAHRVMLAAFVSYAFNLNFGSLVGGVAFRYRLYDRLGLSVRKTTEVVAMSVVTNWLGYALVAGVVFVAQPFDVPKEWAVGALAIRVIGVALVATAIAYVALCAFAAKRTWQFRSYSLRLPTGRFASAQLIVSATSWMFIGGVVYSLLRGHSVGYPTALAVLLAAAVAGVVTYVPAGLGVLEAVFVALLEHSVQKNELLGALLAYRGLYYWTPLVIAVVLYFLLELRAGGRLKESPKPMQRVPESQSMR